jgi:hypothetical protein
VQNYLAKKFRKKTNDGQSYLKNVFAPEQFWVSFATKRILYGPVFT